MSINADWEKFLGGPVRPPQQSAHITISKAGVIKLNAFAHKLLNNAEAVQLFFNKREQKIGIKESSPRFFEAFPVKGRPALGTTRLVYASSFMKHYGIKVTATHKFNRLDQAHDGMLILNLNDTTMISRAK